jgi:RNA polymerase sigma-70 factor (ECF subfamily)
VSLDLSAATDGELAALALAGRQPAYSEIMNRHRDAIYRLINAYLGGSPEVIDVVQEAFAAAFVNLGRYDAHRPFRAWMARIAINKARDWQRREKVRRLLGAATTIEHGAINAVADDMPTPDVSLEMRDRLSRVSIGIANLPHKLKQPLLLRTIEGLSQAETAQALGISEKAVETRVRRARIKLTTILEGDQAPGIR